MNRGKSVFQIVYTEDGFHIKSGFKKIPWPQNMVLVFNLVSQKYYLHQRFLYTNIWENIYFQSLTLSVLLVVVFPTAEGKTNIWFREKYKTCIFLLIFLYVLGTICWVQNYSWGESGRLPYYVHDVLYPIILFRHKTVFWYVCMSVCHARCTRGGLFVTFLLILGICFWGGWF